MKVEVWDWNEQFKNQYRKFNYNDILIKEYPNYLWEWIIWLQWTIKIW